MDREENNGIEPNTNNLENGLESVDSSPSVLDKSFKKKSESNINMVSNIIFGVLIIFVIIVKVFHIDLMGFVNNWVDFSGYSNNVDTVSTDEETNNDVSVETKTYEKDLNIHIFTDNSILLDKDDKYILIDCYDFNVVEEYFSKNNVSEIDTLILCSNINGQVSSIKKLLENVQINKVIIDTEINASSDEKELITMVQENCRELLFGDTVHAISNLPFDIAKIKDGTSSVVSLKYENINLLFANDVGKVLSNIDLDRYNVIVYENSDVDKLISKTSSDIIVSSLDNKIKNRSSRYYNVRDNGNISIITDGEKIKIITEK